MWRFFDFIAALLGIVILSPLLLLGILMVLIDSGSPVFFRQERYGRGGEVFSLLKFRTMHLDAHKRGLITVGGRDPRVTRSGYFLRKSKMDELPQLINVIMGDMSLVGPRPEVARYVQLYPEDYEYLLQIRPGITSPASLVFSNENEILSTQSDPETYYREVILPAKINLDKSCVSDRRLKNYFLLIFNTIRKILSGNKK